jgi:protein phosphatase
MHVHSACLSDVGLKRDHNEDACVADDAHGLYVVCDGMGGAAAGEVASAIAVDRVGQFFRPRTEELKAGDQQSPGFRQRLARLADAAIQDACQHVYAAAVDGKTGKPGMGTTLTLLLLIDRLAVVGHVGDSRAYLKRNNTLYPLTHDHTFVNEMVSRGLLTHEEALKHPMSNLLTKAVGPQPGVAADTNVLDVYGDDVFFLCSDGITKGVGEPAMLQALQGPLPAACRALIDAANAAGGDDNATAVVARVVAGADVGDDSTVEISLGKMRTLAALPLFHGLSHAELSAVVSLAGTRQLKPGELIHAAGVKSDTFFVLLNGKASLQLAGAEVLAVDAGQVFGDVEFFNGQPAVLQATAVTPSTVLTFDRAHLEDLFRRDPNLGVKLLWRFAAGLSGRVDEVLRRGTLTD